MQDGAIEKITSVADYRLTRRVSWSSEIQIGLVETRDELILQNDDLWYDKKDFFRFKEEAMIELKQYMDLYHIDDVREAMLVLYHGIF